MMWLALSVAALLALCGGLGRSQEIANFTRRPAGVAPPDTVVTWECLGRDGSINWLVGDVSLSESFDRFTVAVSNSNQYTNSTLSFRAKLGDNQTMVTCIVSAPAKVVNDSTTIILATPPLPPALTVSLSSNGGVLEAVWRRPFTHEGFPIISYSLTVLNKTTGLSAGKLDVTSNLAREVLTYDLPKPMTTFTNCHSLGFSIIARNSIGPSISGDSVVAGFPIFPITSQTVLYVQAVTTPDNDTELISSFKSPAVCEYQDPSAFILNIYSHNRSLLHTTDPVTTSHTDHTYFSIVLPGLLHGPSLSAELMITSPQVTGEAFFTYLDIDLPFDEDVDVEGLNGAPSNALSVILCLVLPMFTLCFYFN